MGAAGARARAHARRRHHRVRLRGPERRRGARLLTSSTTTTHDPAELLTPEELRAASENARYQHLDPADNHYNLQQARAAYARFADADELAQLPELDAGGCDQCGRTVHLRFRYGHFEVCRGCALSRIHAAHQLARGPARDTGRLERPANLPEWIDVAAIHLGAKVLEHLLHDWGADDDTTMTLLERHSDRVREHARQVDLHEAWIRGLEPAGPGRCARCRRPADHLYLVDGRPLCRLDALHFMPRPDDRQEAA